eukprot:GEMP01005893.1.p1 GENE.GEMP01005893.1~~GEMP01005893.1.p1  ORF type:complete len:471 (+),score=161.59 GEMP01005893.1:144-1556(+)
MPPKEKASKEKDATKREDDKKAEGPPKPDQEKFKQLLGEKNAQITKLQSEIEAIKLQMTAKSSDKDEFQEKRAAFAAEIQTHAEHIKQFNERKAELRTSLTDMGMEKKKVLDELKKTERMYQCKDEDEVDDCIRRIDYELSTTTMTLQEEKKKINEIQMLKKQKPQVTAAAAKVAHLKVKTEEMKNETSHLSVKEQISAITQKCNDAWTSMEEVKKQRDALSADWDSKHGGNKELGIQQAALRDQMQKIAAEKRELRDVLRAEENAYYKWEQEQKRVKNEKREADFRARHQEWEQKKLERDFERLSEQPHLAEITALEQSISFLKSMMPKKEVEEEKENALNFNNPEGSVVLMKKHARDEEFYFAPTKKKGLKQKTKTTKSSVIKHNAETFRLFEALKVQAPSTTEQIPEILDQLESQLTKYSELVAEWQRKLTDGTLLKQLQEKNTVVNKKEAVNAVPVEMEAAVEIAA